MSCSLLIKLLMLIIVAKVSYGILPEYYFETEEQVKDNKTDDYKRDDQNVSGTQHYNYTSISYNTYESTNSKNDRRNSGNHTDTRQILKENNQSDVTSKKPILLKFNTTKKMSLNDLNLVESNDYEDDPVSALSYQQLRTQSMSNNAGVTTEPVTDFTEINDNVTYNNSFKFIADFYNADPAITKLKIKEYVIKTPQRDDYVWYIPEKYPCWDLPVIVGRLGKRKSAPDVFRVNYGKLIDVISVGEPEQLPPVKFTAPNYRKRTNKWCNDAPCFGDHSLCMFASTRLSKICDVGYRVTKPSKLEKISIIGTINSMRNSLARGSVEMYGHLPPAADMRQMLYDTDLEEMAEAWLRQCLPGIDPCSSLQNEYVTQLECTKGADHCCFQLYGAETDTTCVPKYECFIFPVVGCLHAWFASAGRKLTATDVDCGHANPETFNTVQLFWSRTVEMGCAYGERMNGDVRIVCNFAPGAPFFIRSNYFCGLVDHRDITHALKIGNITDVTDLKFLSALGIVLNEMPNINDDLLIEEKNLTRILRTSDLDILSAIYQPGWMREAKNIYSNGTMGLVARLVTKHTFIEEGLSKCDLDEPIYRKGEPASQCVEKGRRYSNLCYDFSETNPGYRLVLIISAVALFSLILYDLFSGVMRQTNY